MKKVPTPLLIGLIGIVAVAAAGLSIVFPQGIIPIVIGLGIVLGLSVEVLRTPLYGVLAIIFFLPFERIPTVTALGYTIKLNHAVGALVLLAWVLNLVLKRVRLTRPHAFPLGALLFISLAISAYGAINQSRAWAVLGFIGFSQLIGQAVLNLLTERVHFERVVRVLVVSLGIVTIFALYQFFGDLVGLKTNLTGLDPGYTKAVFGFPRVHAFSKEPLYFADYLFLPLGVLTVLLLGRIKFSRPRMLAWIYLGGLLVFILTLSRGAFIGAAGYVLVVGAFEARRLLSSRVLLPLFWTLTLTIGIFIGIFTHVDDTALQTFVGHATLADVRVTQTGESAFGRLKAYSQALDAWQSKPTFGVGPGNFGPFVESYPPTPKKQGWDIVNNQYLELLAEGGVVGAGLWLVYLAVTFVRAARALYRERDAFRRALLIGLVGVLVAMLIQLNFFSTLYFLQTWVVLGLLGAVTQWSLRVRRDNAAARSKG